MSEFDKGASPTFRYFYIDPLAAAWMARHFGMRFNNAFWHKHLKSTDEITDMYKLTKGPLVGMFNVHPDSLHLLEPRIGDFVHSRFYGTIRCIWDEGEKAVVRAAFDAGYRDSIIQRDGKPFFWPEQEAV